MGSDDCRGFAQDGVADVGVEFAPIADRGNLAGDDVAIFDGGEFAIIFRLFHNPGTASGNDSCAKIGFEGIKFAFEVTCFFAEDDEAGTGIRRKHGGAKECACAVRVMEENVKGVVSDETGALDAHIGGDRLRSAEQHEGLIEKMRGEIEQNAAAGTGLFAPSVGFGGGTKTIVGGFETNDAAEVTVSNSLAESLEIGVEAAIVVDREDAVLSLGEIEEFDSFGDGGGEGLVDDDVFAGFETALGEREVGLVGSGNGDELDGIDGEEFVERRNNARAGKEVGSRIAGALKNGDEVETFDRADHWGVKTAAAQAKPDETDVNHLTDLLNVESQNTFYT